MTALEIVYSTSQSGGLQQFVDYKSHEVITYLKKRDFSGIKISFRFCFSAEENGLNLSKTILYNFILERLESEEKSPKSVSFTSDDRYIDIQIIRNAPTVGGYTIASYKHGISNRVLLELISRLPINHIGGFHIWIGYYLKSKIGIIGTKVNIFFKNGSAIQGISSWGFLATKVDNVCIKLRDSFLFRTDKAIKLMRRIIEVPCKNVELDFEGSSFFNVPRYVFRKLQVGVVRFTAEHPRAVNIVRSVNNMTRNELQNYQAFVDSLIEKNSIK